MASNKESACKEIQETSFPLKGEPCALMVLVSAVEMATDISRERLNRKHDPQTKLAQELHEERRDEDWEKHATAAGEGREAETNVEQNDDDEDNDEGDDKGDDKGDNERDNECGDECYEGNLIPADVESSLESMLIENQAVIPPITQAVNMVGVEELGADGYRRETGAECQAATSIVAPERSQKHSQEITMGVVHPTIGGEDERVPSNEFHVNSLAPNFQQNVNQPDQKTNEILTTVQMTAQVRNLNRELSELKSQLIRAEERVQLLENVLLIRRGCVHCRDTDFNSNEGRDEYRHSRRHERPHCRSAAGEESDGVRQIPVEDFPSSGNDFSSPTYKMKEDKEDVDLNENDARKTAGAAAKEGAAGLRQLRDPTARTTMVHTKTGPEALEEKATVKKINGSVLGKRKVLDDDAGKEDANSKEKADERCASKGKRVRQSAPKRRRVNWSVEDNYLFMRIVCDNRHLGETRIRRKLADTFSAHRTHEQCANHLRILRAQGRLPPAEGESPTSNTR